MRIEVSEVIDRPVEEVFSYLADAGNDPQWQADVVESERIGAGPVGSGSEWRQVRSVMGRQVEATHRLTDYEPHRRLRFQGVGAPFPVSGSFTFDETDEGTRLTEVIEAEPGGFFKLAAPVLTKIARRMNQTDLANLKDILEAEAE